VDTWQQYLIPVDAIFKSVEGRASERTDIQSRRIARILSRNETPRQYLISSAITVHRELKNTAPGSTDEG
jgi:hypothetical protein